MLAAFLMIVVLIFVAFVVDHGYIMVSKAQLRSAADAGALAGAQAYPDGPIAIEDAVRELITANANGRPVTDIRTTTELVAWDEATQQFVTANYADANAVRVSLQMQNVPSFFGRIMGHKSYQVATEAIAMRQGSQPRDIVLVIDCSTSMFSYMSNGKQRIDNATAAAAALINALGPKDRVGLAVYSWSDPERKSWKSMDRTGVVEAQLDLDKEPTRSRVISLNAGEYGSGTNIAGGLRAGLDVFLTSSERQLEEGEELQKIMVLLTDGQTNIAEPYPVPDDGPDGVLPEITKKMKDKFNSRTAVTRWANTIKARGIILHIVTVGVGAHDSLMVDAATPPEDGDTYYHHVSGNGDYQKLLDVYTAIGAGDSKPKLVR